MRLEQGDLRLGVALGDQDEVVAEAVRPVVQQLAERQDGSVVGAHVRTSPAWPADRS